jgi:hypothetical protein
LDGRALQVVAGNTLSRYKRNVLWCGE